MIFLILIPLFHLLEFVCTGVLENLNAYIQRNAQSKIAQYQIFIWNNQSSDFISLGNETLDSGPNFSSLASKTISASAIPMYPYVVLDNNTNEITGLIGDIWHLSEEYLNFQSNITITNFEIASALLVKGESDVLLGNAIASLGYSTLKFSQPYYYYNSYQLFAKLPSIEPNPMFFLKTLSPSLWYSCIAIFILLSITLRFTIYVINNVHKLQRKRQMEPPLSLVTCLLIVSSGFFNQGCDLHLKSWAVRTQFLIALLFGYTVYTSMSAVLVSEIAVADFKVPYKTMDEMVEQVSICVRQNSFLAGILEARTNVSAKWARSVNGPGCPKVLDGPSIKETICKYNTVVFESKVVMARYFQDMDWKCGVLVLGGSEFLRRENSMMFFRGFQQQKLLALFLEKIRGNGILSKLINQWVTKMEFGNDLNPPSVNEVTFIHIEGILWLYSATVLFSFAIFAIECVVHKLSKQKFRQGPTRRRKWN